MDGGLPARLSSPTAATRRGNKPESKQTWAVRLEPAFTGAEVRAGSFHQRPEARGMVHLQQVHQFVDDHVIEDFRRRLHQAPVQRNGASAGAGTPPAALVSDRDLPDG